MDLIRTSISRLPSLKLNPFVASLICYRNTYILKRRNETLLSKLNAKHHRRLKGKHFIYDLVEDTNLREPDNITVVLTSFVEGIGEAGNVLSVEPSYARTHLLLPKRAVYATPENIKLYKKEKMDTPSIPKFSSIYAGITIRFLSKKVVPVLMNSAQSWTIKPWHIRTAFRIEGIIVPEEAIKLPDTPIVGPDPMKENKDFVVTVTINKKETIPVRCRIFHIAEGIGIAKLSVEYYLGFRDAIFEEQKDLLAGLPAPEIEDNRPESNISLHEKYKIKYID